MSAIIKKDTWEAVFGHLSMDPQTAGNMINEAMDQLRHRPTIYKIRSIIQESTRTRGTVDVYRKDEIVIIDNLETARAIYKEELNNAETFTQYSKYSAIVELFIPHIHTNGTLAYWPDPENGYIEQYRSH